MGRSFTPTYRIEEHYRNPFNGTRFTEKACWNGRVPSPEKLDRHVMCGIVAQYPGYVNEHISKQAGYVQVPNRVDYRASGNGADRLELDCTCVHGHACC
jgi:hypothetical protein